MSDNTYSLETIIVSNPTFCFSIQEYQKAKVRDMLPCHCIICNKDFYTEKRRINKFLNGKIKNLYCSKPCAFEAAKKPVKKHEPYYCEKCGKFVDSEQYYGSGRFCSELCSRSYASSFVSLEDKRKNFIPAKEKRKEIQIQNTKNKSKHERYYQDTKFNIPYKIWKYLPGWDLYLKYGIYNSKTNPDGVDRDHIVSRSYGWKHNIDPYLIKHPANCQFLQHSINRKKFTDCSLTVDELIERAQLFNETILDPDFNLDTFPIKTFHSL